ncbi:type III secretion protein [Pseudomonas sp. UBA1879]|uniref:type III secretion protein n=1 Tax=Pseudomonas sp. UBA1879 TaxID=1947305 RepID=UPI0025D02E25|nr:type III secretion protein [Pseudomonas sp. UBA1879]
MSSQPEVQHEVWQALLDQPLSFVRPQALRDCLPDALSDQQYANLRNTPRFQGRLAQVLTARFNLPTLARTPPPQAADLPVLLLSPAAFQALPRLCGAIWHSATLSRDIRSDVVNTLRSLLSDEVFTTALAHRVAAGAADLLRQPADLVQAIDRDGALCVAAWWQQLPAELQIWLRLRLELPSFEGAPIGAGVDIVRRAASAMAQPRAEVAG